MSEVEQEEMLHPFLSEKATVGLLLYPTGRDFSTSICAATSTAVDPPASPRSRGAWIETGTASG
jgi:hypothetical protein